jgi:hypothetical protein
MKKIYTILSLCLLLAGGNSFAQTFSYTKIDTAKYGNPGDELIFHSQLINSTASTLTLRVTRQQDVMPEAPTWSSAFCMDVCYLPSTDSVTYSFLTMDTVDFTFHMYTSSTADHATAKMRWKNTATPSNTFNQDFFGSTDGSFAGVNELSDNSANVSIYPMPVRANDVFAMNISNVRTNSPVSMVIYNMFGSVVSTKNVISGMNLMNVDLPSGLYSYTLISAGAVIHSGKIAVTQYSFDFHI